jgi:hypothetical protein
MPPRRQTRLCRSGRVGVKGGSPISSRISCASHLEGAARTYHQPTDPLMTDCTPINSRMRHWFHSDRSWTTTARATMALERTPGGMQSVQSLPGMIKTTPEARRRARSPGRNRASILAAELVLNNQYCTDLAELFGTECDWFGICPRNVGIKESQTC